MILADTSIWIEHLRKRDPFFQSLLDRKQIATHDMVIGELACGNLPKREFTIGTMDLIRKLEVARHEEVIRFVESERLFGLGLGWIDMHLLASAWQSGSTVLTLDRALHAAAMKLRLAAPAH